MKKEFYIFRHGETDYNKEGRWQGQKINASLNFMGIEQAKDLANRLEDVNFDVIISSPLKRAHETALIVAKHLGKKIVLEQNLQEGCFGVVEGLLREDINRLYEKENEIWRNQDFDMNYKFEGGESKKEIYERFMSVLQNLLSEDYKSFAISTHGAMMKYLLLGFGIKKTVIKNGEVIKLIYENNEWKFCLN